MFIVVPVIEYFFEGDEYQLFSLYCTGNIEQILQKKLLFFSLCFKKVLVSKNLFFVTIRNRAHK